MRLVSYLVNGLPRYGAVHDEQISDLTGFQGHPTLLGVIQAQDLENLMEFAKKARGPRIALREVALLPPITASRSIFCVGVNYPDRNEEYKDNAETAKYPSLFLRVAESFVGHNIPIERPRVSEQFDYEGEIVLVIGKEGRHIPRDQALNYIAGLTLANEGSVRDWLRHSKFNVTQGKNFDRSGSMGPWLVTADEVDPSKSLHLTTKVNGEIRQDDTTDRMIYPFDYLISYFSTFATLKPGDLIVSGTPTGAGARFDPPRWLVPGDIVEVSVPEIGTLRNLVKDED